jgi:hypothetical protein
MLTARQLDWPAYWQLAPALSIAPVPRVGIGRLRNFRVNGRHQDSKIG